MNISDLQKLYVLGSARSRDSFLKEKIERLKKQGANKKYIEKLESKLKDATTTHKN